MDLPFDRRAKRFIVGVLGVAAVQSWLRSRHRRWSATAAETLHSLPGDDVVPNAKHVRTHAVTVDAPPEAVWPWLVRMAARRAGWAEDDELYVDAGGTDGLRSEFHRPTVGDVVPALRGGDGGVVLSFIDPGRSLVLASFTDVLARRSTRSDGSPRWFWRTSWAFELSELRPDRTRLVVRVRVGYGPALLAPLAYLLALPVHYLTQGRELLGIKSRAEALAAEWDDERRRHR
jgi:hypothetical protein